MALALATPTPTAWAQEIAGCTVFPADNIWNTPVDDLPVHPDSDRFIETIGANVGVHPDFGTVYQGAPNGIPWTTVPGSQQPVPIDFLYDDESDAGPYPIPADAPIEGGPDSTGDRHVLVVDRDECLLYELYDARPEDDGARWSAGSGALFDLGSNDLRPAGWTSADAAGLPLLPGLVRYEEVVGDGVIEHALRFTAPETRREYVWPARHFASDLTAERYPPLGQRFRLRADFDESGFSPEVQVILRALKRYGMMLADNGSSWFLSGAPDPRWDDDTLVSELALVEGSDFEAVDVSGLMVSPDSGAAAPPAPEDDILTSPEVPGFAFRVVISTPDGFEVAGRSEPECLPETLCVSGAVPGRSEVFLRVVGPKPNGKLWPTLVKFSTSRIDVWVEQLATGEERHYVLGGASPGSDELDGLFDRTGFDPQ